MNMGSLDCRWALDTADAGSHADVAGRCARAHAHRTDARSDWGSAGHSLSGFDSLLTYPF
jgi:hypothetical protein